MLEARIPADEAARQAALNRYQILDTAAEPAFDDLTALAADICGTPIALVSFVDGHRQWFKARFGLNETETPREFAFCAHAILGENTLAVPDATADPRFVNNPLVTQDPKVRFYAGAPLITPDGHALGTLCVIDRIPRSISAQQLEMLRKLGNQVIVQLELRRTRDEALRRQSRTQESLKELQRLTQELSRTPLSQLQCELGLDLEALVREMQSNVSEP